MTVANVRDVRVRLGARPLAVKPSDGGAIVETTLADSGYLAVETGGDDASARLIAVAVVPDRTPDVRIERPARDLLLPDARSSVEVTGSVADDIAISGLTLRYTKVSGSGEQIDFVEGELPLQIARESEQQWRARGAIALPRLGLEAGDSLVYRLVAQDGRTGDAGMAASDTYFIEIAGPGQVPLEGVEMPPEQERYALSQQMIVLKIRRLRERERGMPPAILEEQAGAIAAEQRSVRANFVFLMGGHVEDEEEEAEQSHEIQEGRLENSSRRDISRAVSHMTSAEQGLTARNTAAALHAATQAVDALQRAFGRNRYILRTLASRTSLDPSRRLTGARDDVERGVRTLAPPAGDADARRARELLVRFLDGDGAGAANWVEPHPPAVVRDRGGSARRQTRRSELAGDLGCRDAAARPACLWCRSGAHARRRSRGREKAHSTRPRRCPGRCRARRRSATARGRPDVRRPRPMTVLRVIAILVALGGVLDPAVSLSRAIPHAGATARRSLRPRCR